MDYAGSPGNTINKASPSKRRNTSADRKRQLIIESAECIFASSGFHGTTIAEISSDSGCMKRLYSNILRPKKI